MCHCTKATCYLVTNVLHTVIKMGICLIFVIVFCVCLAGVHTSSDHTPNGVHSASIGELFLSTL